MTKLTSKNIDIGSIYSEEARNKLLSVRMSETELDYISEIARASGNTISSFTRKALSAYASAA